MTSWRPLAAGTVALFLIVLAFLAGQLRAGADPALRRSAAESQAAPARTQTEPAQPDSGSTQGDDGGYGDDGSVPSAAPDLAPPATHQS
jgi:hypothetical protein